MLKVATWYIALVVAPLFCGGVYDTAQIWVSLLFEEWGETWQCGDLIYISFGQGDAILVRVRDTGPFGDRCVLQVDGTCAKIVADIPWHVWPIEGVRSASVRVVNITAEVRRVGAQ